MWATEYFNALLIIDYKSEAKENRSQMFWGFLCMSDLSKQQINLSTSKSFYFWISCVWILSDACGLYSFVQFSMCVLMPVCLLHCQHVWHYENGLTCDAFSVSDAGAAKHLLVLSSFFFFFWFICLLLFCFLYSFLPDMSAATWYRWPLPSYCQLRCIIKVPDTNHGVVFLSGGGSCKYIYHYTFMLIF